MCNAPPFLMISEDNNMATIIIATLCILIELYHLVFRSDIELTKSIVENALNKLKTKEQFILFMQHQRNVK